MIQKLIKSNSILLVPIRALFYPDFNDHLRKIVLNSSFRNKLELLKNMQVNQHVIKKTYINNGFIQAVNVALGLDKIKEEETIISE